MYRDSTGTLDSYR